MRVLECVCVCERKLGRGSCVGTGRACRSPSLALCWSLIRRGLLWLLWVGSTREHTENELPDPSVCTHTQTQNSVLRAHTHTNSPSPTLKASGSHRLHASAWKQGPNSHRELFIIFITLLLFWEFSLTWFYYTVIKWWVLSHAPSARSSLLCHKFIDHSNWCMTAAVDADRGLDLVSPHQHSYDTPYHHRLPSTCLMLCFLKATQKWHLSLWRRKRQIQQLLKVSPSLHPVICPTPLCCATRLERWWDWIIYMYLIVWINWITHSPAEPATSGLFGFCEGACAPDHP